MAFDPNELIDPTATLAGTTPAEAHSAIEQAQNNQIKELGISVVANLAKLARYVTWGTGHYWRSTAAKVIYGHSGIRMIIGFGNPSTNTASRYLGGIDTEYELQLVEDGTLLGLRYRNGGTTFDAPTTIGAITSDARFKDAVTSLDPEACLDAIRALRAVAFKWKGTDEDSAGFIAQEVEPVIGEAVDTATDPDGEEFLTLKPEVIQAHLAAAIQLIDDRLTALEGASQ